MDRDDVKASLHAIETLMRIEKRSRSEAARLKRDMLCAHLGEPDGRALPPP